MTTLPPIATEVITDKIRTHLPPAVAQAVVADSRWPEVASRISESYQHDLVDLGDGLFHLGGRLSRDEATTPWVVQKAPSPAVWLHTNLVG